MKSRNFQQEKAMAPGKRQKTEGLTYFSEIVGDDNSGQGGMVDENI